MKKPNNVVAITTTLSNFFIHWLNFLSPFHHMTVKQTEVAAAFIELRYELSKSISDNAILDEVLFNDKSKAKIKQKCNIKKDHFNVVLGELRKKGVLIGNTVNPKYIPKIKDEENFQLLLYFQINDKQGGT